MVSFSKCLFLPCGVVSIVEEGPRLMSWDDMPHTGPYKPQPSLGKDVPMDENLKKNQLLACEGQSPSPEEGAHLCAILRIDACFAATGVVRVYQRRPEKVPERKPNEALILFPLTLTFR